MHINCNIFHLIHFSVKLSNPLESDVYLLCLLAKKVSYITAKFKLSIFIETIRYIHLFISVLPKNRMWIMKYKWAHLYHLYILAKFWLSIFFNTLHPTFPTTQVFQNKYFRNSTYLWTYKNSVYIYDSAEQHFPVRSFLPLAWFTPRVTGTLLATLCSCRRTYISGKTLSFSCICLVFLYCIFIRNSQHLSVIFTSSVLGNMGSCFNSMRQGVLYISLEEQQHSA